MAPTPFTEQGSGFRRPLNIYGSVPYRKAEKLVKNLKRIVYLVPA